MRSTCLRRTIWLLLSTLAVSALVGCGPPVTEVSGTITLRGKAPNVKGLEIFFLAEDGRTGSAPLNPDGTYEARGMPAGDVKVCFVYVPGGGSGGTGGKRPALGKPPVGKDSPPPSKSFDPSTNPIPEPLRDHQRSGLATKLATGQKNTFSYDIK